MFFMVAHFSSLAYKLTTIPTKVVARRMLPRLMSRFVLAEPSAEVNFLPHLLTPMKGITFSLESKIILPSQIYPISRTSNRKTL